MATFVPTRCASVCDSTRGEIGPANKNLNCDLIRVFLCYDVNSKCMKKGDASMQCSCAVHTRGVVVVVAKLC